MSEEIWSGNEGSLTVYVSKAKDLPNLIKLDKQNVMLRLRIAHMTRESDVQFRAGQNPIFNYLEKFNITPGVKPVMHVEVYCERKKKAPLPIGRCEVDLMNGIRADPKDGYCAWYELKREGSEFAGTIFIELSFKANMNHSRLGKPSQNSMKLDESMAGRAIPPLPSESRMSSNINMDSFSSPSSSPSRNFYNSSSQMSSHSRDGAQEYMHASAIRQVTPSLRHVPYDDYDEKYGQIEYETEDGRIPNFTSSVGTNATVLTQDTSNTTVTSTSAETRFHFANLKKLKERINIFKNPNLSMSSNNTNNDNKDNPMYDEFVSQDNKKGATPYKFGPDENGVDIEALEKAIGVTSLEESESESDMESSGYRSRQSYRRPTPPVTPGHNHNLQNNANRYVTGSRRNSHDKGTRNRSPRLPNLPDAATLRSSSSRRNSNISFDSYAGRQSNSPVRSGSPAGRQDMKLPPLPDERIMSSLSQTMGSPRIPRLPTSPSLSRSPSPSHVTSYGTNRHANRGHSASPTRRPLPPNF